MTKKTPPKTLFKKGDTIKNTYSIDCFIGAGAFAEVYRVKHKYLGLQALKILRPTKIRKPAQENIIEEATILSKITHPNVVRIFEANSFKNKDEEIFFIATEFISGETLYQLLRRKIRIDIKLALSIQRDICAGLSIAHKQSNPIIHRDIKPQNILLSYDTQIPSAKVSDFGLAKFIDPETRMTDSAGTTPYMPPEGFWGYQTTASDIFSAGIVFYQMITGISPWPFDYSNIESESMDDLERTVLKARKKDPKKPSEINQGCDKHLDEIILKSIEKDPSNRFKNGTEFLQALIEYENQDKMSSVQRKDKSQPISPKKIEEGIGFEAVAGMDNLKELLYSEIITPLQQKDLYEKYKITLPSGILLYGPPGCGKTFISKKLAEEIDYTFIEVKPSDLASTYVHGSQEKIGKLFKKAREKTPAIIFIDEIDAVLPGRDNRLDHHYSAEVNEFLSQVSECGNENIVVIGTTNRPERIDPAALRTGRFDKLIYVPPPDLDARMSLFNLFLKDRPVSSDINIDLLAKKTENFVASDIKEIINASARKALKMKTDINHEIITDTISSIKPSVSQETINKFSSFKEKRTFK